MLASDVISYAQAGALFRVPKRHVEYIRAAVNAGISPRDAVKKNRHVRVSQEMWAQVQREYDGMDGSESDRQFYFRMRSQLGFPACEGIMSRFCRRMRKERLEGAMQSSVLKVRSSRSGRPGSLAAA